MKEQRRGAKIAMDAGERDEFLASERTCRVATVGSDGAPHATPLWFVWDGSWLWLTSIVRSQRWTDVQRDGRVSVIIDSGDGYMDLRGVEIRGVAEQVGEAPRTGESVPELEAPEQLYADKYSGGQIFHDGRHAWLRVRPEKIVSWDFRKLAPPPPPG
ncbi:MAG TPA: pyridoxamine 5'-phosphate oxidase family protein [Microthrixaceae bacterium]|nr:pyridoxamine 5'-phosphate oxidase family protein [Microthrixaceae bacterium]